MSIVSWLTGSKKELPSIPKEDRCPLYDPDIDPIKDTPYESAYIQTHSYTDVRYEVSVVEGSFVRLRVLPSEGAKELATITINKEGLQDLINKFVWAQTCIQTVDSTVDVPQEESK